VIEIHVEKDLPITVGEVGEEKWIATYAQLPGMRAEWDLAIAIAHYLNYLAGGENLCTAWTLYKLDSRGRGKMVLVVDAPLTFPLGPEQVKSAAANFMSVVMQQSSLLNQTDGPGSASETAAAVVCAAGFMQAYSGKPISSQLLVRAGDTDLTSAKGKWPKYHAAHREPEVTKHLVRFDGRRLSMRKVFFLVKSGGHSSGLEAFYNEAEFDGKLRALSENGEKLLSVEIEHRWDDMKETKHLIKLEDVNEDETEVELERKRSSCPVQCATWLGSVHSPLGEQVELRFPSVWKNVSQLQRGRPRQSEAALSWCIS
jgi:hypothetical protein